MMMKKAFTLIELIFVIVIMGILAAAIVPKTKTNPLQEAAIQLASHLRYTQHLALIDDPYRNDDSKWYKMRWQLVFHEGNAADNKVAYTIFSDKIGTHSGDANKDEIAINPLNNQQIMTGGYSGSNSLDITKEKFIGMKELNLGRKYGITSKKLEGGCSGSRITFDYLGRVFTGSHKSMTAPYKPKRLIEEDCNIVLSSDSGSITVVIQKETGFISIK